MWPTKQNWALLDFGNFHLRLAERVEANRTIHAVMVSDCGPKTFYQFQWHISEIVVVNEVQISVQYQHVLGSDVDQTPVKISEK